LSCLDRSSYDRFFYRNHQTHRYKCWKCVDKKAEREGDCPSSSKAPHPPLSTTGGEIHLAPVPQDRHQYGGVQGPVGFASQVIKPEGSTAVCSGVTSSIVQLELERTIESHMQS